MEAVWASPRASDVVPATVRVLVIRRSRYGVTAGTTCSPNPVRITTGISTIIHFTKQVLNATRSGQAGVEPTSVSVTPGMLEAGANVLLMDWLAGDLPSRGQRELARDVFQATVEAQSVLSVAE